MTGRRRLGDRDVRLQHEGYVLSRGGECGEEHCYTAANCGAKRAMHASSIAPYEFGGLLKSRANMSAAICGLVGQWPRRCPAWGS